MHASSMENMVRCIEWYRPDRPLRIADLGSANVNGSYRELFRDQDEYVGYDLGAGPGVDVVVTDPNVLPIESGSVDLVVTGQMLEHCPFFWNVAREIARILKPEGLAFLIAPSAGPIHRHPVDCYRFYPDSYEAMADWAGLRLVHVWRDLRGPWLDLVGVLQKGGSLRKRMEPPVVMPKYPKRVRNPDPATGVIKGAEHYIDVLREIHAILEPKLYLEIGVRWGDSLRLAVCDTIAIDPAPDIKEDMLTDACRMFRCSSDDFFFAHANHAITQPIDLAFIDGMHLAEYVYRDFINLERFMARDGVIVIDDVLPNHQLQASRERQTRAWCGDVWRFVHFLARNRPDLKLSWLDTAPTGLLIVSNLDPANRALWNRYNNFAKMLKSNPDATLPPYLVDRSRAITPTSENLREAVARSAT